MASGSKTPQHIVVKGLITYIMQPTTAIIELIAGYGTQTVPSILVLDLGLPAVVPRGREGVPIPPGMPDWSLRLGAERAAIATPLDMFD